MNRPRIDRRRFLKVGAAGALTLGSGILGLGCASEPSVARDLAEPSVPPDLSRPAADLALTPECDEPTDADGEGPYYTPGAPSRTSLVDDGTQGPPLVLLGQVRAHGSCAALAGATLDLWHADADGKYDLAGFRLRGVFTADDSGLFRIPTILPGRYLNGATYRPRHFHVKVRAPGHALLTTQLYFPGDPYNAQDGFFQPSLLVDHKEVTGGSEARFDFVLA